MLDKEFDQFYTNKETAKFCYMELENLIKLKDYFLFEPSAGTGSFSNLFHKNSLAIDIEPKHNNIIKIDFFNFDSKILENKNVITIGNPPFGKNSNLAIKFFNKSSEFSEYIAFIIPKTFKKDSVQNKLNLNFHLIKEIEIPLNSFIFKEKEYSAPCIFQIWKKENIKRNKKEKKTETKYFLFTKKEEADIAIRRIGVLAGKVILDLEKYKESSHYYLKIKNKNQEKIYNTLKECYKEFNEIAKNTAGNPSLSKTELVDIFEKKYKKFRKN
jgi:predicted RNA methylase